MRNLKLPLTTSVITPFVANQGLSNAISIQTLVLQNNTASAIWVGGTDVAANNGIQLPASSTTPIIIPFPLSNGSLGDWYAFTAGSSIVLNVLIVE